MSSQRMHGEENFDQQTFNYLKYLPQNQNMNDIGSNFQDFGNQAQLKPNSVMDQKFPLQAQSMMNTFQMPGQFQQMRNPLDNLQNTFNSYQVKDQLPQTQQQDYSQFNQQFNSQKLAQGDLFGKQFQDQNIGLNQNLINPQTQLMLMELLRQQNQQPQQQTPIMNQGIQPSMFGQGFMGATQLLANTQTSTINSQLQSQTSLPNFDLKQSMNKGPTNTAFMSQLYSNLNQYQAQIDQIEKKNQPYSQQQFNTMQSTPTTRSVPLPTQSYLNQQFQSLQNEFRQTPPAQLQYQKQPSAPLSDHQNMFPMKNNMDHEVKHNTNTFNYEPKAYNPNQYSQHERAFSQESSHQKSEFDDNQRNFNDYLGGGNDLRKKNSPPRHSNKERDLYSPPNQNFRYADDLVNESLTIHNNFKESNDTSPLRPHNERPIEIQWVSNNDQYNPHNMSHHSNQILQEQNNNMLNTSYNRNHHSSYSPASHRNHHQGDDENYNNMSMMSRQSNRGKNSHNNVDDIPIKPSTFEELLAKELASQPNAQVVQTKPQQRGERKEFLKRKTQPTTVPQQPSKKYNYYIDNFSEGGKKQESETTPMTTKSEPIKKRVEPKPPVVEDAKPIQMPKNFEQPELVKAESEKPINKKPFLKRGNGTAGGRKGFESTKSQKQQEPEQKELTRNTGQASTSNLRQQQNIDDDQYESRQTSKSPRPNNTFGKAVNKQKVPEPKISDPLRNSMLEFEKLEKECIDKYSPDKIMSKPDGNKNKKKKKIFDSDSDDDIQEEPHDDSFGHDQVQEVDEHHNQEDHAESQPMEDEIPKSNLVRKYFHKEDLTKKPAPQKGSAQDSAVLSEQMQLVVNQKLEQLDKAIEKYNAENDKVNKLKKEYEQLVQKARVNQRELDSKKKKDLEDIEKLKNDELEKLKKEKKVLEQRQKNLQLVNTSNKKEREEIDFLKKELSRVQEESKMKEQKQKATIDRLKAQVEDLQSRNKDLTEELKHMREVALQTQQTQEKKQVKEPSTTKSSQSSQQPRYTFSNQNGQDQQQQQQQPQKPSSEIKGILKKSNEKPSQQQQQQQQYKSYSPAQDVIQDEAQDQYESEEEKYGSDPNQGSNDQPNQDAEDREEEYDMEFPKDYHNRDPRNMIVVEQHIGADGKIQRIYENGKKEVIFNNGVKRETFPDGYTIVYFNNNDIKQTYPDQKVVYYFAEAKTTQSTFPDGLQVFKFANGQVEKHFPDGTKEIIFPDGTIKCIYADGEEESIFPDGTIQRIEKNGIKAIEFSNGQKDILFPDGTKIREFPDGRIRKTYPDGTHETTYRQQ